MVYLYNRILLSNKKNEITDMTCLNLGNIMLSERSHTYRPYIVCFHLYEIPRISTFIYIEGRLIVSIAKVGNSWMITNK